MDLFNSYMWGEKVISSHVTISRHCVMGKVGHLHTLDSIGTQNTWSKFEGIHVPTWSRLYPYALNFTFLSSIGSFKEEFGVGIPFIWSEFSTSSSIFLGLKRRLSLLCHYFLAKLLDPTSNSTWIYSNLEIIKQTWLLRCSHHLHTSPTTNPCHLYYFSPFSVASSLPVSWIMLQPSTQ